MNTDKQALWIEVKLLADKAEREGFNAVAAILLTVCTAMEIDAENELCRHVGLFVYKLHTAMKGARNKFLKLD